MFRVKLSKVVATTTTTTGVGFHVSTWTFRNFKTAESEPDRVERSHHRFALHGGNRQRDRRIERQTDDTNSQGIKKE